MPIDGHMPLPPILPPAQSDPGMPLPPSSGGRPPPPVVSEEEAQAFLDQRPELRASTYALCSVIEDLLKNPKDPTLVQRYEAIPVAHQSLIFGHLEGYRNLTFDNLQLVSNGIYGRSVPSRHLGNWV